ncbi:MAG: ATP-dependent helicase [Solirubrobacteraceae bacterium]|nr:ATP-dependent helicase [Solirubrobacteraceae bacterium]
MFAPAPDPPSLLFDAPAEEPAWMAELNPEQRAAAQHVGSHLLVLAGAGTGKTTTLCSRVACLVENGTPAERILLLTFTRRAAREMLTRAQALASSGERSGAQRVVGGTFHSAAHRIVREHAGTLGLAPDFSLLDAGDASDVMDLVRQEQGQAEHAKRFPRKGTLVDIYSRTVNAQRPLRDVLKESFPWCEEHGDALSGLFRAYTARKRALGVLDLDDLLVFWRALMRDDEAAARIAAGFDHVLVDEYQDVNSLQVDIVAGFAEQACGVTAVGDDFQAIYGFRSASATHILEFPKRFSGAATITLERNYRSVQPLLDVANGVSAQDTEGFPKALRAQRAGGERAALVYVRDQAHEATVIADRVLAAREDGMLLREQAVLARTGHDTDLLELELSRRRIPYKKYGGLKYFDAAHVKDLLAALRLTDRPGDELAWFRVLQLLDGVGPSRARRVVDVLLGGDPPSLTTLPERWASAREEMPTSAQELADPLAAAIGSCADGAAAGVCAERLREAVAPLVRGHYIDGAVRLQDLDVLCGMAAEARDLRSFVAELVLDPPASAGDLAQPPHLDDDWLVLSTVHSAKGLEWQSVHVIAAYDGNFPADMAAGTRESIAEERRLFYVALTRARRSLAIYVPRRYYHRPGARDDAHGYGKASRFLTPEVQALCAISHLADDPVAASAGGGHAPARRIEVSVDELFA